MAIEEISIDLAGFTPSAEATRLIDEVDRMIDAFDDANGRKENPLYVPCDPALLYAAIASITESDLPIGRVFCELGSGFGLGVCLAALLGYEAYGIEIDKKLVDAAGELAQRQGIEATFICGSYFPEGYSAYEGMAGSELVKPESSGNRSDAFHFHPRYEGMDRDTDEIDVFFVYPWPKEHEMMVELFDDLSVDGAILIAYYGDGEVVVYRKTLDED